MKACACTSLGLVDSKPADGIYIYIKHNETFTTRKIEIVKFWDNQSHRQDTNKIDYKGWERTEQTLTLLKNYQYIYKQLLYSMYSLGQKSTDYSRATEQCNVDKSDV